MTLYELTGQYKELMEMAEEDELDQAVIKDTMEGVEGEIEDKADGYAKVLRSIDTDIAAIDSEISRLTARKDRLKNNSAAIKKNLESAMIATGKTKFKTRLFGFGIQKNPPSVVIDDEGNIPAEFWIQQDPKLDKTGIKSYLKDNEGSVSWAHLQQTESLRIR